MRFDNRVPVRQLLQSTAPILGVNLLSAHGAKKTPVGVKVDLPEVNDFLDIFKVFEKYI